MSYSIVIISRDSPSLESYFKYLSMLKSLRKAVIDSLQVQHSVQTLSVGIRIVPAWLGTFRSLWIALEAKRKQAFLGCKNA